MDNSQIDKWADVVESVVKFAILTTMFVLASMYGRWRESGEWRSNAVESGHAEYYLDADHNRKWRWKEVGDE